MKIHSFLSILLGGALLLAPACTPETGGDADLARHIPQDATMVSAMNLKSLMEKGDFDAVRQMEFYQDWVRENNEHPAVQKVLQDPASSGIDLEGKAFLTWKMAPKNPEAIFIAFLLPLADHKAFEELVESLSSRKPESRQGFQLILDRDAALAWNEELALIGGATAPNMDVAALMEEVFNTTPENSIAQVKSFRQTLDAPHDIVSWMSTDPLAQNPEAGLALSMLGIDSDALKGNYVSSYLDFEKGKVVGRSDFHLSDGLGKNFIGMFFKKELETDFSPYFPGENLISVQALALDLKGIDEFLSTRPQAQGYVDFLLRESGMDRPTLLKTFGGDLMLATYFDDEEDFNLLFATGIRDEEEARNILRKGVESNMLRPEEDGSYRVAGFGVPGAFSITRGGADYGRIWLRDGMLFFSNHAGLYEKLKDGKLPTSERAPETHLKNLKNHAFAMNMGFDSFQRIFEESLELDLGSLHFSAADSKLDFLLQLKRQNTNSLKVLFEEINEAYLREKEKAPMM